VRFVHISEREMPFFESFRFILPMARSGNLTLGKVIAVR